MDSFTYEKVNQEILRTLSPARRPYYLLVALLLLAVVFGASCWAYQILTGMGVAGVMHPVMWGIYLVNFVFWVGIAHSGHAHLRHSLSCCGPAGARPSPAPPRP